jgi:Asp-tRNA(Asn)/Glu-tRNA(Gln) amidotransferase C subunit
MISLLLGLLGKHKLYLIGGVTALSIVIGGLLFWKSQIEKRALLEFDKQQLELTVTQIQKQLKQLEEINNIQLNTIKELNDKNNSLERRINVAENYLKSEEAKRNDRNSSIIIRRTIENLMRESK